MKKSCTRISWLLIFSYLKISNNALKRVFIPCILLFFMINIGCATHTPRGKLADFHHPRVVDTAKKVTSGETTHRGKLKKLFYYVRDDIHFGFNEKGNLMKASEVIEEKMGYCNNKATLLLALCKSLNIPAKVHFGEAKLEMFKGIVPDYALWAGPSTGSHGWVDVYIDGKWYQIDSYIIDKDFYEASLKKKQAENIDIGYGIACKGKHCGIDFNLDNDTFVQMDAVIQDHGVWDDPIEYYASEKYIKEGPIDRFFFQFLIGSINDTIIAMRNDE